MGPGTTMLFGLPEVGVRHVEHVAHHPVLGSCLLGFPARLLHAVTIDPTAAFCPARGVVSSSVRQRRTDSPRGRPLRRGTPGGSLAQGRVRVPGTAVPAQGLHRANR